MTVLAAFPWRSQRGPSQSIMWLTVIFLLCLLGGSTLFSILQLEKNWFGALAPVVPALLLHATAMPVEDYNGKGLKERMERYFQTYQYRPPSNSSRSISPDTGCGVAPKYTDYFGQGKTLRSANNEDYTTYKLFSSQFHQSGSNGSYVEMGAFDGIQESNTRFFDDCLGWPGLLIEANPVMYRRLLQNRPNAHCMSFAPSCNATEEQANKTLRFHDYALTNAGLDGHALTYKDKHVVDVPCGPLTHVLRDVLDGHVDFFSLDVEGSEPSVIDNIDFDAVFIEILMVEHTNIHCGAECASRDRVRTRLQQANYTRYSNVIRKSDLYIHHKSKYKLVPGEYSTIRVPPYIATGSA